MIAEAKVESLIKVHQNFKTYRSFEDQIKSADAPTPEMTECYPYGVQVVQSNMRREAKGPLGWALAVQPLREACEAYEKKYGKPVGPPDSKKKPTEEVEPEERKEKKASNSRGQNIDESYYAVADWLLGRGNY